MRHPTADKVQRAVALLHEREPALQADGEMQADTAVVERILMKTYPFSRLKGAANVLIFALWYWELDRGGPADRCHAVRVYPDFLFPQMQQPDLAPPDWKPSFTDYLYLSFTNAISFAASDITPLTRWAKTMMMLQSAVSVAAIALVVARAVNIIG